MGPERESANELEAKLAAPLERELDVTNKLVQEPFIFVPGLAFQNLCKRWSSLLYKSDNSRDLCGPSVA